MRVIMIDRKSDRDNVAWDIETTGFSAADEITVSGFWFPAGHTHVILNGDSGINEQKILKRVKHLTDEEISLQLTITESEEELLHQMRQVVFNSINRDYNRLIAYHGEVWRGGFDLPFLRRRCIHYDKEWVFSGLQYADIYEIVKKRINTTTFTENGDRTDNNDLTSAYEVLFYVDEWDPYKDSEQAVEDYERANYAPLVAHNVADIRRTWELGEIVRKYVSPNDMKCKKL